MLLGRSLTLLSQLVLLLLLASDCHGRGNGAPAEACSNLTPSHGGILPKPTAGFPYELEVTPKSVQPSGRVTLTISPSAAGTEPIKGFFVQARNAQGSASSALGRFVEIDSQHKAVDCNGPASGVTHNSKDPKERVSVIWEAPDALDGDVVFLVSVVQKFDTFWAGVRSDTVMLAEEPTAEPAAEPEPTEADDDDDDDGKGSASSVRAGVALLLAPLAMAVLHRLL